MKLSEAQAQLANGHIGCIAEYRSSKAEEIKYTEKATGRQAIMKTLRHNLELGDVAVAFNERVEDSFNVADYKPPYQKGQKVLVSLTSLQNDKGVVRAAGKLTPLI